MRSKQERVVSTSWYAHYEQTSLGEIPPSKGDQGGCSSVSASEVSAIGNRRTLVYGWVRNVCLALVILVAMGCGSGETGPNGQEPPAVPATDIASRSAAKQNATEDDTALARVFVRDMDGNPLPNMLPIASREPNAFNKPIAT
ncbi:MAG: hypothetical protein KJ060_20435, partial [Candidatus Hydrogenedentes bacterium]|nr:hypothetical protein [Candidatus Hydrogenedentota bacterium]